MNANEWAEMTKLTSEIMKLIEKNRGQKEEIEFLKKEILAKHEDWKHEGQQAANARAEIEALKNNMNTATNELLQKQDEIEALKAKLKQYHLKEDLDRNLNLIYGKEFIK